MSSEIVQVGATITCPHMGNVTAITSNTRVKVSGQPVVTMSDTFTVAGCTFLATSPSPQPCILVRWLVPATRVRINGQQVILKTSTGICQSAAQAPQGPPNILVTQPRVKGM
ncbi:MAG: DUF4280 domain-containing protein [Nitrosopumilus sp.]|nr:DUF4280 domain-containing protein [Nitrosopumilus sp.]MDH3735410.1 DUF4280 domain-containing protein [Nitrosopumilus sp.]MDH3822228.1 DUF4280 domain-containing protein [Nitrosopumilus sp.]MDH3832556.1 DUF4280 domain-containing protein [Nitrosopumilus sp.]